MLELLGVILTIPSTIVLTLLMYPISAISTLLLGETDLFYDMFIKSTFVDLKGLVELLLNSLH